MYKNFLLISTMYIVMICRVRISVQDGWALKWNLPN